MQLEHAEALIKTIKGQASGGTDRYKEEAAELKLEVNQLKIELAKCLKVTKNYDLTIHEKDL